MIGETEEDIGNLKEETEDLKRWKQQFINPTSGKNASYIPEGHEPATTKY